MSCEKGKPEEIPYYYKSHNIIPNPGNDWVCVKGEWIWTVKGIEKAQVDIQEKQSDAKAFTPPTRDMYGSITYHGKQYIVWGDSKYGDYIAVDSVHYQLNPNWWTTHYKRTHGETQIRQTIPRKSMDEVMNEKRWSMPGLPDLKLPSIGLAGKGVIGILVAIGLVLLALLALGYSGLGGSVGRVAETEHKRKRG